MSKYNNHVYRKSDTNLIETIQIAINRNSAERDISEQHLSKNPLNSSVLMGTEEICDLIPPFSPSSSNSLSVEQWIETVEDLREIYGWNDRLTVVYASLRLEDAAKRWSKENVCDWPEFKVKIVLRFSTRISKPEYFEQLLSRRKENNESYENYVFDIERTALKCDCSVESTINYIISGLRDSSLRSQLFAYNCKSVDELLSCINKITAVQQNNDELRNRPGSSGMSLGKEDILETKRKCYKCRKRGHFANNCWLDTATSRLDEKEYPCQEEPSRESVSKRSVMCVYCKSFGHYASECHLKEIVCHICKGRGHKFYDCRLKDDSREERKDRRDPHSSFREERGNSSESCRAPLDFRFQLKNDFVEDHDRRDRRNSEHSSRSTKIRNLDFCTICNSEGHHRDDCRVVARDNLSELFCKNCNQKGHKLNDCQLRGNGRRFHERRRDEGRREEFCVKCKRKGHHIKDCRDASSSFKDNFCQNCRRKGHKSDDCHFVIDQKLREERRKSRSLESSTEDRHRRDRNDNPTKPEIPKFRDDKFRKERSPEQYVRRSSMFSQKNEFKNEGCNLKVEHEKPEKYPSENKEKVIKSHKDRKDEAKRTCYHCRKIGHYAIDCPSGNKLKRPTDSIRQESPAKKLRVSEEKIERKGLLCRNNASEYPRTSVPEKKSPNVTPHASIKLNRNLSEFLKPVRIDNVYVTALVNLASDCTTLQWSEFEKHDWKFEPCNLEINGSGHSSSNSIGIVSKNVCIEEVELVTDILIVEDDIQDFPLVLGSNFLDHPSVCVVKKYRSLEIKLVEPKTGVTPSLQPVKVPPPASYELAVEEEQTQIKTEPELELDLGIDVEDHLNELLSIIKEDFS